MGLRQHAADGRWDVSLTGFHLTVRDQISFDQISSGSYRYVNIARTLSTGEEAEATYRMTSAVSFRATYTHTDARDEATGARLVRVPPDAGSASLLWDGGRWNGAVTVRAESAVADLDPNTFAPGGAPEPRSSRHRRRLPTHSARRTHRPRHQSRRPSLRGDPRLRRAAADGLLRAAGAGLTAGVYALRPPGRGPVAGIRAMLPPTRVCRRIELAPSGGEVVTSSMAHAYEADFHAWALEQATLLRSGRLSEADAAHIAQEIEFMGKSEKRELVSRLTVLLLHLLKWRFQPGRRSASGKTSISNTRDDISDHLIDNPSLRGQLDEAISAAFRRAHRLAVSETGLSEDTFPQSCPWTSEAILGEYFWLE